MAPTPPNGSTRTPGTGNFQGVSPVLLSSACDVVKNNSAIPDSGQLSYPFRKAIVIEEIRWDIRCAPGAFGGLTNMGALVSTKLQIGRHLLMRDAVPLWVLGTFLSQIQEEGQDTSLLAPTNYSHYRWRLPKPLYIEAGDVLRSQFSRGDDSLPSMNVRVSYAGKTVAPDQPIPSVIAVPYAAPFVTTLGNVYQQSNENHLFNMFDVPLRIQRLTGRVLLADGTDYASVVSLTPSVQGGSVTLLMNDSWGGKMVNNNTGPSDIFDAARGGWTVDTIMPPKGVYEARVWNIPADRQVHIAMVGFREEAL